MNRERWLDLPGRLLRQDAPTAPGGGHLKAEPHDFVVEELPAYLPCGEGDWTYLLLEKVDIAAPVLAREVARRLRVPRSEVGMAGMKDRRAVTRQWISVPGTLECPVQEVEGPLGEDGMIRLLDVSRHTNRLKTGHLRGNRFSVRLRDRDPAYDARVRQVMEDRAQLGFVNAYGAQRWGRGDTVPMGLDLLGGARFKASSQKRLATSALQAAFFNHWAAARVADGLHATAIEGDVLRRRESGGAFTCEDPATDTARLAAGELVLTGPLPGSRPSRAAGAALAREAAIAEMLGVSLSDFSVLGRLGRGTRRELLAFPEEISVERDAEGLVIGFALPSGSYASVLLETACDAPLNVGRDPT